MVSTDVLGCDQAVMGKKKSPLQVKYVQNIFMSSC